MEKIPVLAVIGPTASGKTKLAVFLARHYGGEVVSADSMQIYRGMAIGTAQPTEAEKQGVPHHLIGIKDPAEPCSVAEYVRLAGGAIEDIHARGLVPVVAGGTGLYADSLLSGLRFPETPRDEALRARLREKAEKEGGEALLAELAVFDPETAAVLHPHNLGRVIRAIEVFRTTGVTMAEMKRRAAAAPSPYRVCRIGLSFADRRALYARIDARVDAMMAAGLLDEAKALFARGEAVRSGTAMQAIGYKELAGFLRGETPLPDAVEAIKRATRRYAKRQMTWFRRDADTVWLEASADFQIICKQAARAIDNSGVLCYNGA